MGPRRAPYRVHVDSYGDEAALRARRGDRARAATHAHGRRPIGGVVSRSRSHAITSVIEPHNSERTIMNNRIPRTLLVALVVATAASACRRPPPPPVTPSPAINQDSIDAAERARREAMERADAARRDSIERANAA